jgi:predicted RND superfamily exporter protein
MDTRQAQGSGDARIMTRLVLWAHRRRSVVLVAAAAVLAVSLAGIRGLTFDTDVIRLLPQDGRAIPSFRTFLERFGSLDQLYVVFTAPDGQSIRDYDREVAAWVDALRAAPEIERVDTGTVDSTRNWSYIGDRQLLLLGDDALARALVRFTPAGMDAAVRDSRELLAMPSPEIAAMVRQDPLGLFGLLREQLGDAGGGLNIGVTEGGYISADGRQRLLIARPRRPPYDTEFSHALYDRLGSIERDLASAGATDTLSEDERLPPVRVEFAGGHRIAIETEAVVRRESITNGIGSLALILPLLFIVFRSPWLVAIGAIPSALSLLVVLGLLGITGATLSAAATGASAMLFGLGVDGVVLLYVSHRLALAEGVTDEDAVRQTAGPSASMLLGMWTTAATFYGLTVVDFPSLEQLGRLIGHSMVVCGLLTLFIVPAMLPRARRAGAQRRLTMPRLAGFVKARATHLLIAAVALSLLLAIAATRVRVNPSLERLRSVTPAAALEAEIGRAFGLPSDVYAVLAEGPDLDQLLRANEALVNRVREEAPGVRVHAPTLLLPSDETQARRAERISAEIPATPVIRTDLQRAAEAAGFKADTFDPFYERVDRLRDPAQRLSFDGYAAQGLGDVLGRFIVRSGETWTLATYLLPTDAAGAAAVEYVVAAAGPGHALTGLPLVNRELAERFTPQFIRGLAAGSIVVVLLILVTVRSLKLSLLSLIPTAVGLLWAAGLLGLAGVELDLFAIFAVLTFVGIGVDYGIHMIHRFQERGDAERACAELAPVILVAGAITLLGYGTLMTSSYPPLRSIGLVSVVSVFALVASSIFVLPALLIRGDR